MEDMRAGLVSLVGAKEEAALGASYSDNEARLASLQRYIDGLRQTASAIRPVTPPSGLENEHTAFREALDADADSVSRYASRLTNDLVDGHISSAEAARLKGLMQEILPAANRLDGAMTTWQNALVEGAHRVDARFPGWWIDLENRLGFRE